VRIAAISAIALWSTWSANAGTNQFTLVGPEGGQVGKVLLHPTTPSIAYALTGSGYYRSTDSGLTWRIVGEDLFNPPGELAVDPSDPNRIIFAVPGDVPALSTDAGATVARVSNFPFTPFGVNHVAFSADGSAAYATTGVRVFRSTDGGRNWSERTAATANPASVLGLLRVDPLDPDVVYVSDLHEGGLHSADGGGTWQPFPLPERTVDLAISPTTPRRFWAASSLSGVHVSTNGGATWPVTLSSLAFAIALDPQDPSVAYAGTFPDGLFRTSDGGNGWANVQGNARIGTILSIAINPLEPAKLMLGGGTGVAVGTPGTPIGGTWETRNRGIFATIVRELAVAPGSSRVYVHALNAGVHVLADGAATTTPVNIEAMAPSLPAAATPSTFGLLAQSRGSDRLYVGISPGGYVRSDDGGATWQAGSIGSQNTVTVFADSPGNADLIVASSLPGLHRSIDGGDSWIPANAGLPARATATAMVFSPAAPSTVYAGIDSLDDDCCAQHGVYRSVDGGVSWSAANTGFETSTTRALAVDPTNAQVVYAAADADGLLKTTNGGASWSRLAWANDPGNTFAVAVDPELPNVVYVAGGNHLARSVDAGATWQVVGSSAIGAAWQANTLLPDPRRPGTLLVSTFRQGAAEITVAPNLALAAGAVSFSPVAPGAQQTYRYRLHNAGPFHATGARVLVTLPTDTTGISATTTNGSCSVQGTTVTCTAPVLETATAADIVVHSSHPAVGTVEVLASANGDQPDPVTTDNEVRYTISVAQLVGPSTPAGSGGGGGTSSLLWVLALATLRIVKRQMKSGKARPTPDRGVSALPAAVPRTSSSRRCRRTSGHACRRVSCRTRRPSARDSARRRHL
jgi:uncharacterized repeat protein (TIGR01451 family)